MSDPHNHIIWSAIAPKEETSPTEAAAPPPAQVQRSKSRLVRLLTTRKPTRSNSPPVDANNAHATAAKPHTKRPPPVVSSFGNREQREAALRERGLLPPLPQKDLSELEAEQDRKIPIVMAAPRKDAPLNEEGMSAADIIKKEWEAKNKALKAAERQAQAAEDAPTELGSVPNGTHVNSASSESLERGAPHDQNAPASSEGNALPRPSRSKGHEKLITLETKALPLPPPSEKGKGVTPVTPVLDLPYGVEIQAFLSGEHSPETSGGPTVERKPSSASKSSKPAIDESHAKLQGDRRGAGADAAPSPANPSDSTQPEPSKADPPGPSKNKLSIDTKPIRVAVESRSKPVEAAASSSRETDGGKVPNAEADPDPAKETLSNGKADQAEPSSGHGHRSNSGHESDTPPPVPPRDPSAREERQRRRRGMTTDECQRAADDAQALGSEAGPAPTRRKTINPFKRNNQADGTKRSLSTIGRSVVGSVLRPSRGGDREKDKAAAPSPDEGADRKSVV